MPVATVLVIANVSLGEEFRVKVVGKAKAEQTTKKGVGRKWSTQYAFVIEL